MAWLKFNRVLEELAIFTRAVEVQDVSGGPTRSVKAIKGCVIVYEMLAKIKYDRRAAKLGCGTLGFTGRA